MQHKYDPSKLTGELLQAYRRFGSLTAAQVEQARLEAVQAHVQGSIELTRQAAPVVQVDHMTAAFARARSNGLKKPKLRLSSYLFKCAPENHQYNAGAIYVIDQASGFEMYLGKIMKGRFIRAQSCTAEQERGVLSVLADPFKAVVEFGKQTGSCSICARTLTDPESIAAGVGPVCREKFGW